MSDEQQIKSELKNWILSKSKKVEPDQLSEATPLLEGRIISSLQIMELILFIEKLKGSRVVLKNIRPGAFSNINSIYQTFFVET